MTSPKLKAKRRVQKRRERKIMCPWLPPYSVMVKRAVEMYADVFAERALVSSEASRSHACAMNNHHHKET